jgi:hypoxanthine phosphoribosyltransferase
MAKIFISAEELLRDSFELGVRIIESGYRPTFILGVWRGGTPVGIAIQEVLELCGFPTDHFAIRTSSYGAGTIQDKEVKVYGLQHVADTINSDDQLLIIDDVFDSGRSVQAIIKELKVKCRRNTPEDIRVATVYYKPAKNKTNRVPDFHIHQTDNWLVFPHELRGCTLEEMIESKPFDEKTIILIKEKML